MPITTVLLDLDGVVRHFDPAHTASVEQRYGLHRGIVHATALEPDLLGKVTTGQISRAHWVELVGKRIGHLDAARESLADLGTVDPKMIAETNSLRSEGIIVAVLTNGTDTIPTEMDELGLDGRFDAIFNSADLGLAKPDPATFATVCTRLGVDPAMVFFTDDSAQMLTGAIEIGMTARLFQSAEGFRRHLVEVQLRRS